MAFAVVPAAGASRRMGAPKLLLPFGDGTVLGATVAALREGGCTQVIVVTAPADGELQDWLTQHDIQTAVNPAPERGMLSTLWAGIDAIGAIGTAAGSPIPPLVVSPGDLPRLQPATVRAVLAALGDGAALAWPRHGGRNGHPLAIAAALAPEVRELDLALGLRSLRDRHRATSRAIAVDDPGCVEDIDTPEDYRTALKRG